MNNDGRDDIITGADEGAPGGHVKVFDGITGGQLYSFFAYDASFAGGVRVASADINADGWDDIVVGDGVGGPGLVRVYSGFNGHELASFFAFGLRYAAGVYVAATPIPEPAAATTIAIAALFGGVKRRACRPVGTRALRG